MRLHSGRPGGGQHYSPPSPSRSSGSWGAGSSGWGTSRSSRTPGSDNTGSSSEANARPYTPENGEGQVAAGLLLLGIVVVVVVALLLMRVFGKGRPARVEITPELARPSALAALRAHDPEFDAAAFTERARGTVGKVNEAWLAGDMTPARRLVSDGVFTRFQTQLALLRAAGLRNQMADWRVENAGILAAAGDALWDTLHVWIEAQARDSDVATSLSAEQAAHTVARAPLERYQEIWSFVRRRGARGHSALEGKCPGCGAPLPLAEVVRCEYCNALANSGEHDWVLAEITQTEEWRGDASAGGEVDGLAAVRARDPQLSRQALEDRASLVFWKWIEARVTGKRTRLDRFCAKAGRPEAPRATLSQVAVGSADLVTVASGELERARVAIRWSESERENHEHVFTLVRAAGAASPAGLSSLTCPACGGDLGESDDPTCRWCRAPLVAKSDEWALSSIDGS